MACVRYFHEIKNVPLTVVDDSRDNFNVRDWLEWGKCHGMHTAENYFDVRNYLANAGNPLSDAAQWLGLLPDDDDMPSSAASSDSPGRWVIDDEDL